MFALLKELVWWAGISLPLWFQTVVEKGEKRIRGRRPKKHMCVLLPLGSHRAQLVPTASHTSRPLSSLSLSSSVRVQKFQTALREKPTTVPGLKDNTQRGKMENAGICSSSCCSVRGEPRLVGLLTPRRRGAVKWRAVGYREPVRPPTDFLFFFLFFSPLVRGLPPSQEEQSSAQRHLSLSRWTLVLETCSSAKAGEKGGRGPDQSCLWSEYNFWNVAKSVTHSSAGNWLWKQLCSCSPGLPISLTWWQRCRVEQWGRGRLLTLTDLI